MFSLLCSLALAATVRVGEVTRVVDGDTFWMKVRGEPIKVRLQGVDCPEKDQKPGGPRATRELDNRISGTSVQAEATKTDPFGRLVAKVVRDGKDIGLELVEAGQCYYFRRYKRELSSEDQNAYEAAEARAKVAKLGVWGDTGAVEPWEHRRAKRKRK